MALLVFDLRDSVRAQDGRAREVAQLDAARGARELRAALRTPAVLERVPEEQRFTLLDGELVVPKALGWIEQAPVFDPMVALDAVARDHLVRAERASSDEARKLWQNLRSDPTLRGEAQAWTTLHVAWFAERLGDATWRDELLDELSQQAPQLEQVTSAELGASLILLCAKAQLPPPAWVHDALTQLPDTRAEAVLMRLKELGWNVDEERRACASARKQRATLRAVQPLAPLLAADDAAQQRAVGADLLLYYPSLGEGALLSSGGMEALIDSLTQRGIGDSPPVSLGGRLSRKATEAVVVEDLFGIAAEPVLAAGLTSGPAGLALLAFALASISGVGVFVALRSAKREAETAQLRSEFVTGVTHELKTPLAGIRLTADLLADGHVRDEDKRHEYLLRLGGEAQRLGALIDNVLDLGRLERGERGHDPERADLVELTKESLALFDPVARRSGKKLIFKPAQTSMWALVDRDALRQALLNVLDNARKYGDQSQTIEVGLDGDAEGMCLWVRDFGPGVPPEERELVFERFRRGAQRRDGKLPGVGLGLYLARALLRRQGGDLSCVAPSNGGAGARFEMKLPSINPGETP